SSKAASISPTPTRSSSTARTVSGSPIYQLRGRVGRAQMKAYAYLMLPRDMMTEGAARKRINAIKQYSTLGAGFKIAMRDLEIRGAGNVLGTQQSGHIIAIGFDLY